MIAVKTILSSTLRLIPQTVINTLRRDRSDAALRKIPKSAPILPPGVLLEATPVTGGAKLRFENAALEVVFLAPNLARLSWEPGAAPLPYALAKTEWPTVQVTVEQAPEGVLLESAEVKINVCRDGAVRFQNASGQALREDQSPRFTDQNQAGGKAWVHTSALSPEESIYGLGERAVSLNRRGRTYRLWNLDPGGSYPPEADPLYLCIPVYLSMRAEGSSLVFYENAYDGTVRFEGDRAEVALGDGMLRYYFIAGSPQQIIERYTELTGRPPLPPRWALGYHQSRWGYKTEADIRRVAAGFKEHDLPLGVIHLDIDYMQGFRVFTVDRQRFPNLKGLAHDLHQDGVRLVTIIDPGVKKDKYFLCQEGIKENIFCTTSNGRPAEGVVWPGWALFPDFTNPKGRAWWGKQYQVLLEAGVDGFWHDMNEPASFAGWGSLTLPLQVGFDLEGRRGTHAQAHNVYGLLMNQAGYEGLRALAPHRRPWIVSRSGWAGNARFAWNWTGDTETSWPSLAGTLRNVLGLGLSGIPFCGPDTGGFSGQPDEELYLRWFQLSAFLPFFRTHSALSTPPREPWTFGEPALSIIRSYLRLRCRLLPYFYTLAWETTQTGAPPARPMFWDCPGIPAASVQQMPSYATESQFFLGQDLLVAPVFEKGASSRKVWLPPGAWVDFWEKRGYEGSQEVDAAAGIERIPIFVRCGSLLPIEEDGRITLHAYPDATGQAHGLVYLDDGDGYGPWRLDRVTWSKEGGLVVEGEGDYPQPEYKIIM